MTNLRKAVLTLAISLLASGLLALARSNPVPLVNSPLVPATVAPGRHGFKLTVNGTGFVSGSRVNWNGMTLPTTFVSSSQLAATVPASDVVVAGTASVTVVSPAPGGGPSNAVIFDIRNRYPAATFGLVPLLSDPIGTPYASADFNRDGKLDLALTNSEGAAICLGNGDGTFQGCVQYIADSSGFALTIADVNGDGIPDVVIPGYDNAAGYTSVSVLLGNGDGTFQQSNDSFVSSTNAAGLAVVGDFNGDGKQDIAVGLGGYQLEAQVAILLGNGDGTFQAPNTYTLGTDTAFGVVAGDFNGDGNLDLVVAVSDFYVQDDNLLAVLLGNGDGTFQTAVNYPTPVYPVYLVTGDFNADGKLDLAATGELGGLVTSLGNGDGTFQPFTTYSVPGLNIFALYPLFVGDFNGDGKLDLVTTNDQPAAPAVFVGGGDGTFQPAFYPAPELILYSLVPGDFDGDGKLDLVGLKYAYRDPTVYLSFLPQVNTVLSTGYIDFGVVPWGSQSAVIVSLTNAGTTPLTIEGMNLSERYDVFHETNNCGHTVAPGTTCAIKFVFKPLKPGSGTHGGLNGQFRIRYRESPQVQEVALTGMSAQPGASPTH